MMNNDSQTLRWDISKGNPEVSQSRLHQASGDGLVQQVEMDLSNESVEER